MAMREYNLDKKILKFLRKIRIGFESGCWEWLGKPSCHAYRQSWFLFRGKLLEGHDIHHTCINHWCVNPWHLEQLTESEHYSKHVMKRKEFQIYQQPSILDGNVLMFLENQ